MTQLGKYELHEQIGKGGFGTVYHAIDTSLNREVALKVLHPQFTTDPDFLERFRNEARLVASLHSPNIVTIHDLGEVDGRVFIALEYLSGGSLKQKLEKEGPLPFEKAHKILKQVCNGLSEAHEQGLVHRDIKPGNILFDSKGNAILGDFGVAKIIEEGENATLTGTGIGLGTPEYMAPEQWVGESVPASDQYSLGVVLYEMVTGHKPYTAETPAAVLLKQANEPLPPPREFVREIPESLEKILFKMLAKKPQDRYTTLADLDFALGTVRNPGNMERKKNIKRIAPKGMPDENSLTTDSILLQKKEGSLSNMRGAKKWRIAAIVGAVALVSVLAIIFIPGSLGAGDAKKSFLSRLGISDTLSVTGSEFDLGDSIVSETDGMTMIYIPAGEFPMGSEEGEGNDNEKPQHLVYLDAYWIDKTEVTNAMYQQCVDGGHCSPPEARNSAKVLGNYYGNDEFDNYPVINVTWYQARDYCEWAGRTLPTEAQWEKAARGTDGRIFPWGDSNPHRKSGNYYQNVGDTYRVGSYSEGASPYGALDMAGNVSEWVADWYGRYSSGSVNNPTGKSTGDYKILKGGSWDDYAINLRSALRTYYVTSYASNEIGFRCALILIR